MALPVTAAFDAGQAGTMGVGFSGAGFLIPFFLGVIDVLQRQGVLQPSMPMAGASSGALAIMTASDQISLQMMREEASRLSAYCLKHGNCYGTLQAEVRRAAQRLLPRDAADRANKHGRLHVAVTYPSPSGGPVQQALVGNFTGRDDLREALEASIYIPYYAGAALSTSFRGKAAYDGSFAGSGPGFLPCPPGVSYCLRVSSLPACEMFGSMFGRLAFGRPSDRARGASIARNVLGGADLRARLAEMRRSFRASDRGAVRSEAAQAARFFEDLASLRAPDEGGADIFPGRRHPLPVSHAVWSSFMMQPGTPEQIEMMYRLGQAEARSWAEEAGFIRAGLAGQQQAPRQLRAPAPGPQP
ncbi:hypothetical protein Rsub_06866 [Raphidocelis subcapitata]|uniref:PNPLA domain-containing protein n=1 Tax=Raphidocelis subcapitata TaxID=307507 RepID=A0A2V0P9M4_9CHLO|nr:hypothetical protein Rsub_06866 [Raphidocelis subcapitata]|eukprot:GBF93867.1 hypothetical protein Rsub_06866 [Raphidocelis subcapitata]